MSLLPKSIHRCRRYPTKFNSGRDIPELVRTRDSRQIWGEQYQRTTADIFDIQENMAREISDALRLQLTTEQEELLTKQFTTSSSAYEAYLKGRYHWNRRTEEGIRQAIVYFQEAIREDPSYALAYSGLADSYTLLGFYYESPRTALPQARAAAERALELDDRLGEAHASLAFIKTLYDWDFAEAEQEFQRAIELNPTYATAYHWYSVLLSVTGRHDESIQQIRRAAELDPLSRIINSYYGQSLAYAGRHQGADEQLRKTLELDPSWALGHMRLGQNFELPGLFSEAIPHYEKGVELADSPYGLGNLGHAYAKSGRVDDAYAVLERLEELAQSRYVAPIERANVYAGLGDLDSCFEWLEKAYDERSGLLPFERVLPVGKDIEHDPRFSDLMRRVGLEE